MARSLSHHCSGNAAMLSVHNVELHVTVNNIKILSVAQEFFYDEFMSPAIIQRP
jgi:hypothetical protein